MHVLYLHQYFVPPDGPGGTRSYEMARRMVAAGHRVTMVTSSAAFPRRYGLGRATTTLEIDGIEIIAIPVAYDNSLGNRDRILSFARFALGAALHAVRCTDPDVVFATSTPLTIAFPGILGRLARRCPMVFEVRDLWPEVPIAMGALSSPWSRTAARSLERLAYACSTRIVALSPGMAAGVANTGYPRSRVHVIPNGSDLDLFRVDASQGQALRAEHPALGIGPLIVYAGTLGRANGVGYLVDVAAAAADAAPELRFVIAGAGAERDAIIARAAAAGVLDRTLFVWDPRAKSQMPALLSAATVATSLFIDRQALHHNSANKFFDALASGTPVMINYEGWQADLLRETGAGIVVPVGQPQRAAQSLVEWVDDQPALARAGAAATTLAQTQFARDQLAAQLIDVLEQAAAEGPRFTPCTRGLLSAP
ncbi:MAG: glycosyltransferase family 4 protein [Deltaproteobacteria bacterium]|nr:glycosyltransferase family 4 protein [Deltaproteobacteria bacterium]